MRALTYYDPSVAFEDYFWRDIELKDKIILDAGTGFGVTTAEIAKRIQKEAQSTIVSIDINTEALQQARSLLKMQNLLELVAFIRADLSSLPIKEETIDLVVSTRTLACIESFPCRVIRAIAEFYRALKTGGRIVMSDEYPTLSPSSDEEEVAVVRWQLVKAISHLIGRPHASEIFPEDLEFVVRLAGFRRCRWAVFKGEKISDRRINYFIKTSTEMCAKIIDPQLKHAFSMSIQKVKNLFKEKGGVFPRSYIFHAWK